MLQLADQGVRGFRIYPTDAPIENWLDGSGFERMFAAGAAHNLAICPLINPDALPALSVQCERFPENSRHHRPSLSNRRGPANL